MSEETISKLALAQRQLETAIGLFVSRTDQISSITLAGAADGILHGLVLREGKQPFADYALGVTEALTATTPARAKFAKHVNDTLNINDLKHMDEAGANGITFDPTLSAMGAILKAIANHRTLVPDDPPYINAMLSWTWQHFDGEKIAEASHPSEPAGLRVMQEYENRPQKIRALEKRLADTPQARRGDKR